MRRIAFAVAALALLWVGVVQTGRFETIDAAVRMNMAHAWWTGGDEIDVPDYGPASRAPTTCQIWMWDGRPRCA